MNTDINGVAIFGKVAKIGLYDEITIRDFSRMRGKHGDLKELYSQYLEQANALVEAYHKLTEDRENIKRYEHKAAILLGKAAYTLRQAMEVSDQMKQNEEKFLMEKGK